MAQHSFFHLTSPKDHECITAADLADERHLEWCASMPKAEHKAMLTKAMELGASLQSLIDEYCDDHPETSYGLIFEALFYVRWGVEQDMNADAADA